MKNKISLLIKINEDLKRKIKGYCVKKDLGMSAVIETILREWIEKKLSDRV